MRPRAGVNYSFMVHTHVPPVPCWWPPELCTRPLPRHFWKCNTHFSPRFAALAGRALWGVACATSAHRGPGIYTGGDVVDVDRLCGGCGMRGNVYALVAIEWQAGHAVWTCTAAARTTATRVLLAACGVRTCRAVHTHRLHLLRRDIDRLAPAVPGAAAIHWGALRFPQARRFQQMRFPPPGLLLINERAGGDPNPTPRTKEVPSHNVVSSPHSSYSPWPPCLKEKHLRWRSSSVLKEVRHAPQTVRQEKFRGRDAPARAPPTQARAHCPRKPPSPPLPALHPLCTATGPVRAFQRPPYSTQFSDSGKEVGLSVSPLAA
jgi:hypothetical protein